MPTASINGIKISYVLYKASQGQANTKKSYVVLVNGLADPKETWSAQIPDLTAAGYNVLAFDNRGIGETSAPAGPYSASLLAADTKALVTHLNVSGRFHLVGVSMGGMIAQSYALAYPADVLSLTLACTYAAPGPFCSRMFSMWADGAQVLGVPYVMRDVLLWAFTPSFFTDRPDEVADFEEAMRYIDQSTPAYLAQLAVIQRFDTTERLKEIKSPTLVLAGEQDILIPVALSRNLHNLIGDSKWVTVKGGHGCMWEFPGEFNEAVVAFIDEVETQKGNS